MKRESKRKRIKKTDIFHETSLYISTSTSTKGIIHEREAIIKFFFEDLFRL